MKTPDLNIDAGKTAKKLQQFIQLVCKKEGYGDVLIALSGGVDSATSLALSARALGPTHVHPVFLPYGKLNGEGAKDAKQVSQKFNIPASNITTVDIKPFVDKISEYEREMDEGRRGNIMARVRTIILYDLSKKFNFLVVGTENRTEHLLGYYTRFGDEASDIEPIRELYKTQVFQLAKYLKVPQGILTKAPTAGLWEGQTDEGEFGFPYKIADEILYLYKEKNFSKAKIMDMGYSKKIVERLWWWIEKGEFKDRLPYKI